MMRLVAVPVLAATLSGCSSDPPPQYRFLETATACETLAWAEARSGLLEAGDTAEAEQYASGRCFRVEPTRAVVIEESEGGFLADVGRWVLVVSADGTPLEHLASAEFRRATGQPVRDRGWVRGAALERIEE
ncbi:MAG: hypothetical protein OEN56_07855 [Gemmatimonadota bacterium]|nr:hypothetical protein [Gemmatimonadota bacterium]